MVEEKGKKYHFDGHQFSLESRSKLINWMIKAYDLMGLKYPTFFMAMHIFDLYSFYSIEEGEIINADDLYLIGITI